MNQLPNNMNDILNQHLADDDKALIYQGLMNAVQSNLCTFDDLAKVLHFFDARGLACPMPLLKAKLSLRLVAVGSALYLLASDKNSQTDLVAYCQKNNLTVATWGQEQGGGVFHFVITKNS